jgi:hypothetical protein
VAIFTPEDTAVAKLVAGGGWIAFS